MEEHQIIALMAAKMLPAVRLDLPSEAPVVVEATAVARARRLYSLAKVDPTPGSTRSG